MADLDDSTYLEVILDDELLRYIAWAYYGGHDQVLIRAIDRSFNDFYSGLPGGNPNQPNEPGQPNIGNPNQ